MGKISEREERDKATALATLWRGGDTALVISALDAMSAMDAARCSGWMSVMLRDKGTPEQYRSFNNDVCIDHLKLLIKRV